MVADVYIYSVVSQDLLACTGFLYTMSSDSAVDRVRAILVKAVRDTNKIDSFTDDVWIGYCKHWSPEGLESDRCVSLDAASYSNVFLIDFLSHVSVVLQSDAARSAFSQATAVKSRPKDEPLTLGQRKPEFDPHDLKFSEEDPERPAIYKKAEVHGEQRVDECLVAGRLPGSIAASTRQVDFSSPNFTSRTFWPPAYQGRGILPLSPTKPSRFTTPQAGLDAELSDIETSSPDVIEVETRDWAQQGPPAPQDGLLSPAKVQCRREPRDSMVP